MTYGIKFAGSKVKLLPQIKNIIDSTNSKTVLDAFAGSTRVSQYLASDYTIICNDISPIIVFGECFLLNKVPQRHYFDYIEHLNNLVGIDGWFTEKYGGAEHQEKKAFQIHNTRKLDAIRNEIDRINLNPIEKSTILTSLLLALDKVDSTLGHQSAYLKKWSPRSFNILKLEIPDYKIHDKSHKVLNRKAHLILDEVDLMYADVPYGTSNIKMPTSRVRYDSYYHLYKSVVLNDKPEVFGRNNRRVDSKDKLALSDFESTDPQVVKNAFAELFNIKAKYFLFSYSTTAKLHVQNDLLPLIESKANIVSINKIDHKKHVMSNMSWTNEWLNTAENFEYLILAKR